MLFGIAGPARSGKDTVADFIIALRGGRRYSFADPIRNMLKAIGIDMNQPYWQARKEQPIPILGVSPRRMMQTLGTEWGRQLIHPDLWLIIAEGERALSKDEPMVISDVRFENEAAWIRNSGGRMIHVTRANAAKIEPHASENGVGREPQDVVIENNGTLEQLYEKLRRTFG